MNMDLFIDAFGIIVRDLHYHALNVMLSVGIGVIHVVGVNLDDPVPIEDEIIPSMVIPSTLNMDIQEKEDEIPQQIVISSTIGMDVEENKDEMIPFDIPFRNKMECIIDIPSDEEEEEKESLKPEGRPEIRECKEGDMTMVVDISYQQDIARFYGLLEILNRIRKKLIIVLHVFVGDGKTSLLRILMTTCGIEVYAEPIHLYAPYLVKFRESHDAALKIRFHSKLIGFWGGVNMDIWSKILDIHCKTLCFVKERGVDGWEPFFFAEKDGLNDKYNYHRLKTFGKSMSFDSDKKDVIFVRFAMATSNININLQRIKERNRPFENVNDIHYVTHLKKVKFYQDKFYGDLRDKRNHVLYDITADNTRQQILHRVVNVLTSIVISAEKKCNLYNK